ncbi:MAG: hypothetical protein U1F43_09995 [Myxococcota bacterium]
MTFDDPAREALELRIDAYLDGLLSVAEARATERMLADPEVGAVLAEAIALRELLAVAPGDAPPDGLEERIIDALGVGSRAPREADAGEGGGRFGAGRVRRQLDGARRQRGQRRASGRLRRRRRALRARAARPVGPAAPPRRPRRTRGAPAALVVAAHPAAREAAMIVLDILGWILLALAALLALLLVMPLRLRAEGAVDDEGWDGSARIAWAFGFLSLHADVDGMAFRIIGIPIMRRSWDDAARRAAARKAKALSKPPKKKAAKPKPPREPRARRGLRWFLSHRGLLAKVAGRYVRALHLRGGVDGVVGMPDPSQTASVFQVLAALDALLPDGMLDVQVDWVEEVLDLEGRLGAWLWPLEVVVISLALVLDRKTWRALRGTEQPIEVDAAGAARRLS